MNTFKCVKGGELISTSALLWKQTGYCWTQNDFSGGIHGDLQYIQSSWRGSYMPAMLGGYLSQSWGSTRAGVIVQQYGTENVS